MKPIHPVQVMKRVLGEPDKYGEREVTYASPVESLVYGWEPPGPDEELFSAKRDAVVQDLNVYVPPGFDCEAEDRIVVGGLTYRAVGDLRDYTNGPFGFKPGGVVRASRVKELG